MELILWRHAEAEDGFPDMARVLTEKGHKQASDMAAWLKKRLPTDTRILVSPAIRTQQTALALTKDFSTVEAISPGADAAAILNAAGWPREGGTVLIVGHQPTLGEVLAHLLVNQYDSWSVKKGSIWWLASRKRGNGSETILKAALTPDLL
jgi:phosphohistidine phosphatase